MKFKIETWTVERLLEELENKNINLNPPYQRNAIWKKDTQQYLVGSIQRERPIPNIFLYEYEKGKYEMVDGQQRTRAMRLYYTTDEIDLTEDDSEFKNGAFLQFQIPVTIITHVDEDERVDEFYYMVNSSGIHLNRPEKLKGKNATKSFLKLVEGLLNSESFKKLDLIPVAAKTRMLDRDLVEELCALILHGITDKKGEVDKIYQSDIDETEYDLCEGRFNQIVSILDKFDQVTKIKTTRYRQRNDLYTLFSFLKDNLKIESETLIYFYKILVVLQRGIRPSRLAAFPLSEYAFNCITQSNSSTARMERLKILNELLLNTGEEPNTSQQQVMEYYPADGNYFVKVGTYLTFNVELLGQAIESKDQIEE